MLNEIVTVAALLAAVWGSCGPILTPGRSITPEQPSSLLKYVGAPGPVVPFWSERAGALLCLAAISRRGRPVGRPRLLWFRTHQWWRISMALTGQLSAASWT